MSSYLSKDRIAGLAFILVGLVFVFGSGAYSMGKLGHMGPGYFPRLLSWLLVALGAAVFVSADRTDTASDRRLALPWRPLLAICLSIAFFGLLLKTLGLCLASFGLVVIASFAQSGLRWKAVLSNASVLSLVACVVFAWGLKLPLPVLPVLP